MAVPMIQDFPAISSRVLITALLGFLTSLLCSTFAARRRTPKFPVVALSEEGLDAKESWFKHGKRTVRKGLEKYNAPFQVLTGTGPKIILPNRYADDIKDHPDVSIGQAFAKDFFGGRYPGFESFRQTEKHGKFLGHVVRVKLRQALGEVIEDFVDETAACLHELLGDDTTWHSVQMKPVISHLIARMSSRVFVGRDLCRNKEWLRIAEQFTEDAFTAAYALRQVPAPLRPLVHWFLSPCRKLRGDWKEARQLLTAEVNRGKSSARESMALGMKTRVSAGFVAWMYELSKEYRDDIDYVSELLNLTIAAIHSTSEATASALLSCCSSQDVKESLRAEMQRVIGSKGWSRASLMQLNVMDSFLKETHRCYPISELSLNRLTLRPIKLHDGLIVPANAHVMVADRLHDPTVYADPEKFDAFRFYRRRSEPGWESQSQFTNTSRNLMTFGYGRNSCPGRFFADHQIKVALCHLLMEYDIRLESDSVQTRFEFEVYTIPLPDVRFQVRKRTEKLRKAVHWS